MGWKPLSSSFLVRPAVVFGDAIPRAGQLGILTRTNSVLRVVASQIVGNDLGILVADVASASKTTEPSLPADPGETTKANNAK